MTDVYREIIEALPRDPRDLIPPADRERLRADLIEMARLRRRAEGESQCLPMA